MRDALGRVRRVLLLGGSSAIGVAVTQALVDRREAREVVLAARRPDDLGEVASNLEGRGATVERLAFDLTDVDAHGEVVERAAAGGDLDVVVLAAGVLGDQARAEQEPDHALEIIDANFRGAASVSLHVARQIERQGHGALVVLSSIAAVQPRRSNFVYGASKAGIDAFARGLDDQVRPSGGRVLVVRPGFVRTPMTDGMDEAPMAQDPDDVAEAVLEGLDGSATVVHSSAGVATASRVFQVLPRPLVRRLPR